MKIESELAGVKVGPRHPVRILGVINVSPESFYQGSVRIRDTDLAKTAEKMEKNGADFIDIGAMSTAPYLETLISERDEARRLAHAVRVVKRATSLPISLDTSRRRPAQAGFEAGASILNDISGLNTDSSLAPIARLARGVILMAHPSAWKKNTWTNPLSDTLTLFRHIIKRAKQAKIRRHQLVLDPGVGFFRTTKIPWWQWDLAILKHLTQLEKFGYPLMVGISRKSFIGHLLGGKKPSDRLPGSLAATVWAVQNGASLIRTHDVGPTREAIAIHKTICNYSSF